MKTKSPITQSKDILGGVPVFAGTRVPVQTFVDYLLAGDTLEAFLDDFPTVQREQVIQFLEQATSRMIAAEVPFRELNN